MINIQPPVQYASPSGGPISVQPYFEFPDIVLIRLSQSNFLSFRSGREDLQPSDKHISLMQYL